MQEKVFIKNDKGLSLAAVIHYPQVEAREKLAILCPGYLDSKDYKHLVGLAEELANHDYTVVRFNPTGTWDSEGSIEEYTTTQYLKDIKSVLEYMFAKQGYSHILLGGHSRGGKVSILYAARDPRISLVLGIMQSSRPISDQRRQQAEKDGFSISKRDTPDKTGEKEFRVPYTHFVDNDSYNVLEEVKKIHVPIILVAGELDDLVLPKYVKEIFDNSNEPKKFILVEGIGHDYRKNLPEIKIVNDKIIEALI